MRRMIVMMVMISMTSLIALSAACGGETVIPLEGVTVETVKDANDVVTEVAMNIDLAKVEEIKAARGDEHYIAATRLPFDADAQALGTTVTADVGYAPHGHGPPGLYDQAHFDVHFYGISEEEVLAIDCSGETEPAPENVPPGYVSGGVGEPPFGSCIKQMGIHFSPADPNDPTKPQPFSNAQLIIGYSKGKLIFFEPMIPESIVFAKEAFSLDVPRPEQLGRSAQWPAKIDGAFDEADGLYRIGAKEFSAIE